MRFIDFVLFFYSEKGFLWDAHPAGSGMAGKAGDADVPRWAFHQNEWCRPVAQSRFEEAGVELVFPVDARVQGADRCSILWGLNA